MKVTKTGGNIHLDKTCPAKLGWHCGLFASLLSCWESRMLHKNLQQKSQKKRARNKFQDWSFHKFTGSKSVDRGIYEVQNCLFKFWYCKCFGRIDDLMDNETIFVYMRVWRAWCMNTERCHNMKLLKLSKICLVEKVDELFGEKKYLAWKRWSSLSICYDFMAILLPFYFGPT